MQKIVILDPLGQVKQVDSPWVGKRFAIADRGEDVADCKVRYSITHRKSGTSIQGLVYSEPPFRAAQFLDEQPIFAALDAIDMKTAQDMRLDPNHWMSAVLLRSLKRRMQALFAEAITVESQQPESVRTIWKK